MLHTPASSELIDVIAVPVDDILLYVPENAVKEYDAAVCE